MLGRQFCIRLDVRFKCTVRWSESNNIYLSYCSSFATIARPENIHGRQSRPQTAPADRQVFFDGARRFSHGRNWQPVEPGPIFPNRGPPDGVCARICFHACGLRYRPIGRPLHMHAISTACCSDLAGDVQEPVSAGELEESRGDGSRSALFSCCSRCGRVMITDIITLDTSESISMLGAAPRNSRPEMNTLFRKFVGSACFQKPHGVLISPGIVSRMS